MRTGAAASLGTSLAICVVVNRLPEYTRSRDELVPFDPIRRALEARIELAKERLFADLDEAQRQLRRVASTTVQGLAQRLTRAALVGGVLVLGLLAALALRRRRRRLRVVWR